MRSRSRVVASGIALALGGGFLVAGPGTGCTSFLAESALFTADFCFIFDCQNGILGGTIDPCPDEDPGIGVFTAPAGPLFIDCP
jgi:hypothetical protein